MRTPVVHVAWFACVASQIEAVHRGFWPELVVQVVLCSHIGDSA